MNLVYPKNFIITAMLPIFSALLLPGCTPFVGAAQGYQDLNKLIASGWIAQQHNGIGVPVVSLAQATFAPSHNLLVYIEGDGNAWTSRSVPSANPTPRDPVGLKLAVRSSPATNSLYLARPCQYVHQPLPATCTVELWTKARYGERTLRALNDALDDRLTALSWTPEKSRIYLIGYSGGATMALLMAAGRTDVAGVITVAGNLDIDAWTSHHKVSPLDASFNPASLVDALADIPQVHWRGELDRVVPLETQAGYLKRLPSTAQVKVYSLVGYDHTCCWLETWRESLGQSLAFFASLEEG